MTEQVLIISGFLLMVLGCLVTITPSKTLRRFSMYSRLENRMWQSDFCNSALKAIIGIERYDRSKQEWFASKELK